MSDVLAIQNTRIEGSGFLGKILSSDGFDITSINAKHEKIPDEEYSFLIVLGAPESANDDRDYLKKEQELIRRYVSKQKPVLGICLGSQLIAKAFGAKVFPGPKKEIGFYHDLIPESQTGLFSGFDNPFTVFHWHGDTFDLPSSAKRLVRSSMYQNQAFQIGTAVGLQFHLEVDDSMVNLWLDNTQEKIDKIPYIDPQKIRDDIDENITLVNDNLRKFYKNFKSEFDL
ncbi:MAG: GMP synthase [Crenarchaeota archaeon]|nr:MAG: GMP synthase [Thermoproteota archaeon]RDJ32979.1 MAG: GMP synthase [Thermoproteota archaeon]RDJ35819.1 MAG: GMP synthase [Thermoproteota archaeon]RDJ36517.1 MAG: GMP synthase [Thermoproteota archaeon]